MSDQEDLVRAAAVFSDMGLRPGQGPGCILHVLGMLYAGGKPIVGNDHADSLTGQEFSHRRIEAATAVIPHDPGAAMVEYDDREIFLAFGDIEVEPVAIIFRLRTIDVGEIADFLDRAHTE